MKLFHITLQETLGIERVYEPVAIGVPFVEHVISHSDQIHLQHENGHDIPADKTVTARWPDGSVRWCLFRFSVQMPANAVQTIAVVQSAPKSSTADSPLSVTEHNGVHHIDTGRMRCSIRSDVIAWSAESATQAPRAFALDGTRLKTESGSTCATVIEQTAVSPDQNRQHVSLRQIGRFTTDGCDFCRFESTVEFFAGSSLMHWRLRIHNPKAAEHAGGLWDLGNSGSIFFRQLTLGIKLPEAATCRYQLEQESVWSDGGDSASVLQASSGGEQWNSRNHIDHRGELHLPFRGYRFAASLQQTAGLRASPIAYSDTGCSIHIERFWQQFPKAMSHEGDVLSVHLFPEQDNNLFELQGGESKTHSIWFDFGSDPASLAWAREPLQAIIPPEYLAETRCLQHFTEKHETVEQIIAAGLEKTHGFLAKREVIDEYGWRNFGDVFADHECLYLPPGEFFISHYNNQYDTVYGFLRQFLHTGNRIWWQLANELTAHVIDIDIYDTCADRTEYNGGLFWHTDHYVDAFTASHRTYSRHQNIGGNGPTGGGPGPEHCYSQGLMLHHFLTGSAASKRAVLSLTQWMTAVYEGTGTVVEQLLQIKSVLLPKIRQAGSGRKVLNHRLPMTRGVGNYINTVLDSFTLTGDQHYLSQVDSIIRRTVSPLDNIDDRNFGDIELTWHYTVFLQSVIRYVETKKLRHEGGDDSYRYALDSVMHYANWMAAHEAPYMQFPERLEFPNDTWYAQDFRKAHILYFASCHSEDATARTAFRNRGDEFYQYVVEKLSQSQTKHFARILGILMQNHGPQTYYAATGANRSAAETGKSAQHTAASPYVTRGDLLRQAAGMVGNAVLKFSLRNELSWLRFRHPVFAKAYRKLYE